MMALQNFHQKRCLQSSSQIKTIIWRRCFFVVMSSILLFILSIAPSCITLYCEAVPSSVSANVRASSSGNSISFQSQIVLSMLSSIRMKSSANASSSTSVLSSFALPSSTSIPSPPTEGPIEYATCRIEDLEQANDSQLYTILDELRQTAYFKTFLVNLDKKCPLQSWGSSSKGHKEKDNPNKGGHSKLDLPTSDGTSVGEKESEQDQDEFECTGGADELDEDAEPLCTVAGDDGDSLLDKNFFSFGSKKHENQPTSTNIFESNALYSLSQDGYQSQSQHDAFSWNDITDQVVVSPDEDADCKPNSDDSTTCNDPDSESNKRSLPDTFWNDMCLHLQDSEEDEFSVNTKTNGKSNVVNLMLNPERNTGYNGTHIWRAIYEENCITAANGDDSHMCFEERVLYRLLSGLHTSTTISIAMNYYPPSKRKNRPTWEPNPSYFMSKFEENPDHIRNLHFSYAVLLRALHKAKPMLYEFTSKRSNINTGNTVDDETTIVLLRRLLDSSILKSCSQVFNAFDESLMFQEDSAAHNSTKDVLNVVSLQKNFKGVFHNVSRILDCVQCQQCKLHGKVTMLGYGTALKILFIKDDYPVLNRNEIVAFINTIAKFSESIRDVRHLTQLYWLSAHQQELENRLASETQIEKVDNKRKQISEGTGRKQQSIINVSVSTRGGGRVEEHPDIMSLDLVDNAIAVISALGQQKRIGFDRETELIQLAFQRDPNLLLLAKHYAKDTVKFLALSDNILKYADSNRGVASIVAKQEQPDAIIVGSGLAGLAASLNILDRGGRVIIIEKEHTLGGNSNKASSGINACCPTNTSSPTDSLEKFETDTIKSAGESVQHELVSTLVSNSANAIEWLRNRVGIDLSLTSQLGGHTDKRTHRPNNGMVGAEIIYGIQKAVRAYEKTGAVKIIVDAKVTRLITTETDDDPGASRVIGVEYMTIGNADDNIHEICAPNVILATGGFASDRSNGSYLQQFRPELMRMPTTAGTFSTGDGIKLATELGAGVVDMDKVQVHPTGWVDPSDPNNPSKTLAAELMRGVGGILVNNQGKRFCNELGTRAYVTEKMLSHNETFERSGKWDIASPIPTFSLILSSSAAADGAKKHVDLYTRKGLMKRLEGVSELAAWMGIEKSTIVATLTAYQKDASKGKDRFGKTTFRNIPGKDFEKEVFYAGRVTPVLHYCMGGITIDKEGNVLNGDTGEPIAGLHAAGEVTGGVHGVNRLAGNSLLECTVFGTIVGQKIPINSSVLSASNSDDEEYVVIDNEREGRVVPLSELQQHNTPEDCWVAIHGVVYDLTEFALEHPPGAESIYELAGTDGTAAFDAVHNQGILDDFDEERIGIIAST